jgi:hypothetical protein
MDDLFKRKLQKLRQTPEPKSFAEALYGDLELDAEKTQLPEATPRTEEYTEREQVLSSLEQFAQEKLSPEEPLKFPGGEIALKPEPGWEDIDIPANLEGLTRNLTLQTQLVELSLLKKKSGQLKALFVSESFRSWDEIQPELTEGFINEILPAFPHKTSELFTRMLLAMKFEPQEILLYPSEHNGASLAREVIEVAGFYRPEVIITLGAKATHRILKSQDRLSMVHGQFFQRRIGPTLTIPVVPLFHPSIIENSPGMKKTAWADMQKIMKHLKKL